MSYQTVEQVAANSLGRYFYGDICDKKLIMIRDVHGRYCSYHYLCPPGADGERRTVCLGDWLIAVKKPTQRSVSEDQQVTNKISDAVSQSPLFNKLPQEIREKIWEEVVLDPLQPALEILPLQPCPHVVMLEIQPCQLERDSTDHCHCVNRKILDRFPGPWPKYQRRLSLLYVCKAVQMEVLTLLFKGHQMHFPDTLTSVPSADETVDQTLMRTRKNRPREENEGDSYEVLWKHRGGPYESDENTPGGFDGVLQTFRPFCSLIRSMRIETWFDTDCIDVLHFPDNYHPVTNFYTDPVTDLRTPPATNMANPKLPEIFSDIRELRIHINPTTGGDLSRPRYLVEKEFFSVFHPLSRLPALEGCSVSFEIDFDKELLPQPEIKGDEKLLLRRKHGRRVGPGFLKALSTRAEDLIAEGNENCKAMGDKWRMVRTYVGAGFPTWIPAEMDGISSSES